MTEIHDWNPDEGDLCQGDVLLFRLPDGYIPARDAEIEPRDSRLILAEGEATGHHHAIWMQPQMFRDDALAHAAPDVIVGVAQMFRDDALVGRLERGGHITTRSLAIGLLTVERGPVVLRHQEHDAIRIPPGDYYVGRQQEFNAGEVRRVQD